MRKISIDLSFMNFSFYFPLSSSCLRKQLAKIGCVLSRLLSGKFLLEKCWKGGEITEDIGIRSDDVEGCFGEEGIPRNYEGKI